MNANLILNIFTDYILPIIIILLALVLAVFIYKQLQKKFNKPLNPTPKPNEKPQVKLREPYCSEEEMKFLDALHKALPRECISFPNVGVSKLIEPRENLVDYKLVKDKFVDICIFLRKGMKPILVIDLYSPAPTQQQLKKFDDNITNVLKVAKVPILHKEIQRVYNTNDLLQEILNNIDQTIVAYLNNKK